MLDMPDKDFTLEKVVPVIENYVEKRDAAYRKAIRKINAIDKRAGNAAMARGRKQAIDRYKVSKDDMDTLTSGKIPKYNPDTSKVPFNKRSTLLEAVRQAYERRREN
jgi:hypothetical protein